MFPTGVRSCVPCTSCVTWGKSLPVTEAPFSPLKMSLPHPAQWVALRMRQGEVLRALRLTLVPRKPSIMVVRGLRTHTVHGSPPPASPGHPPPRPHLPPPKEFPEIKKRVRYPG